MRPPREGRRLCYAPQGCSAIGLSTGSVSRWIDPCKEDLYSCMEAWTDGGVGASMPDTRAPVDRTRPETVPAAQRPNTRDLYQFRPQRRPGRPTSAAWWPATCG